MPSVELSYALPGEGANCLTERGHIARLSMGNPQSGQDARAPPAVSCMLRAFLPVCTFRFALVAAGL